MMGSSYSKRAFTLIELLVVISIIAMLSSLVLGAVSNARTKAYYAKAALDSRTVGTALELYFQDHGAWPQVIAKTGPDPHTGIVSWPLLGAALSQYLPNIPTPAYQSEFGVREYIYLHGSDSSPVINQIFNSKNGSFVGCVSVKNGYFLDFYWLDTQTPLTLGDGGFDPDGIDRMQGDVTLVGTETPGCTSTPPPPPTP